MGGYINLPGILLFKCRSTQLRADWPSDYDVVGVSSKFSHSLLLVRWDYMSEILSMCVILYYKVCVLTLNDIIRVCPIIKRESNDVVGVVSPKEGRFVIITTVSCTVTPVFDLRSHLSWFSSVPKWTNWDSALTINNTRLMCDEAQQNQMAHKLNLK